MIKAYAFNQILIYVSIKTSIFLKDIKPIARYHIREK